jgi:hypothetical protein
MGEELRRREFIKSAFLGANGLLLSGQKLDFLAGRRVQGSPVHAYSPLSGLIYQNDFSNNMDGIASHATLHLRLENGQLKFSTTNAGRGIFVGPSYPAGGKQYTLVIKLSNAGNSGLKVYRNRPDAGSFVESITTTNEVAIPFVSESNAVDNRLFLATANPEYDLGIEYVKIYETQKSQTGSDLWAGTYQQTIDNRLFTWIPSRDAILMPQPNGSVILKAPETKSSFLGGNTCRRFVYDDNYRRLGDRFLNDLFSGGVFLPDGHYHYLIHYFNAPNYDTVDAEAWKIAGNPATYRIYSASPEAISFSIETFGSGSEPNRVTVPATQERASWLITNQYLPENLTLPAGKDFGITRMHWDVVPNDKLASINTVLNKVTQIQVAGRQELDAIHPDRLWDCITGTGQTAQQIAGGIRLSPKHGVMGQMKEQGISNAELEQAFRLMYQRLQNEFGVTNPNQTKLYEDYFASTDGYGNGAVFNLDRNSYQEKKRQLSSRFEAMKLYGFETKPNSEYFLSNAVSYRNRAASGYLDSYQRTPNGIMLFRLIFEYEKSYMSANDRNVMCMSWAESEGVNSEPTRSGIKYRLRLPGGDLLRPQSVGLPFEMLKNQSFFALLLGTSYTLWNDSTNLVKDIKYWVPSSKGGTIEFHEENEPFPKPWDIHNSKHPKPVESPLLVNGRQTMFPSAPQTGEQAAWVGAYLYSQISTSSDRVSQSIRYASFSYRVNDGATQTGYRDGNEPVNGSLGNPEITRAGVLNEGQHNIVDLWEFQKPIVIVTRGGNGFAVIIKNVFCEPTDKVVYSVQVNGNNKEITHVGRSLAVFLFS